MATLEDLVLKAQGGDEGAYSEIVQRFQDMALSYAYSILADYDLAEDARQEAFLGAYCDLLSLREPAAFPGWFRKIVLKHSINFRRKRRMLLVPIDSAHEIAATGPGPVELIERSQEEEIVREAISSLPAPEQEATRLFYIEGLSLKEVGDIAGIPSKTVRSRLHTARTRMRNRLTAMAKDSIWKKHLAGDKTAKRAATAEAIEQFEESLSSLLKVPSKEDLDRAADMLCAKGRLHRFMGDMDAAIGSFEAGLTNPVFKDKPLFRARLQAEIGLTRIQISQYGDARKALQTARQTISKHRDQSPLLAAVLNGLGMCAWGEGDFQKARTFYEETAVESRRVKCEVLSAEAQNNLALLDWKAGRLDKALESFKNALRAWKSMGNRFGSALTLMNVGIIEENLGQYASARQHYGRALASAREINYVQVQAATLSNLSNLALVQEKWNEAFEYANESLELTRKIGDRRSEAVALENMTLAHVGLGETASAGRVLEKARALAKAIGDRERLFSLDLVEIEAAMAGQNPRGLAAKLAAAEATLDKMQLISERPRLFRLQAQHKSLIGDQPEALAILGRGIAESQKQKNRPEEKKMTAMERALKPQK